MKILKETIFLLIIFALAGTSAFGQFDDLYYDASDNNNSLSYEDDDYDNDDDSFFEEAYEVDEDSYDYFDDFNSNDDYYQGYEYSRRINRFNRGYTTNNYYSRLYTNPVYLDRSYSSRFWYDPFYSRSFSSAYLNPYLYGSGLSININVGNRLRRVSNADLYFLYTSGAISYSQYRRGQSRSFGSFGRYGGLNTGFGGGYGAFSSGSAYYCPPIGGISRVTRNNVGTNNALTRSNNQVVRSKVNTSRRSGTRISNRGGDAGRVSNARGGTIQKRETNGRDSKYARTRGQSTRKGSITKERRNNNRSRGNSIRNSSSRNNTSARRAGSSRRSSGVNSSRRNNNSSFRPSSNSRKRSSGVSRTNNRPSRSSSTRSSSSRSSSPKRSSRPRGKK
ncbi:MAG: hypothetical protein V3V00_09670 [Saprospiraceae bacterium]